MKKFQIYGVLFIVVGIAVICLTKISFISISAVESGWTSSHGMLWMSRSDWWQASSLFRASAVLVLIAYAIAFMLVVYGVLLLLDKWNDKLMPFGKPIVLAYSLILFFAGLLALLVPAVFEGFYLNASRSIGAILFIVMGVLGIMHPLLVISWPRDNNT
jgi:prepilin signal peptidase PulO-like enzyme (type II secretory pathway)